MPYGFLEELLHRLQLVNVMIMSLARSWSYIAFSLSMLLQIIDTISVWLSAAYTFTCTVLYTIDACLLADTIRLCVTGTYSLQVKTNLQYAQVKLLGPGA